MTIIFTNYIPVLIRLLSSSNESGIQMVESHPVVEWSGVPMIVTFETQERGWSHVLYVQVCIMGQER